MIGGDEIEGADDEDAEQVAHAFQDGWVQRLLIPRIHRSLCKKKNSQPPREGKHDEHRRQQRRTISLARHQEGEDQAGAGGENEAPGEDHQTCRLGPGVEALFQQCPQVDGDQREHAAVEQHIPCEDGSRVVMGGRHDEAVRPPEVEHEHHEAA